MAGGTPVMYRSSRSSHPCPLGHEISHYGVVTEVGGFKAGDLVTLRQQPLHAFRGDWRGQYVIQEVMEALEGDPYACLADDTSVPHHAYVRELVRVTRPLPAPPKFGSVAEAEAWIEATYG